MVSGFMDNYKRSHVVISNDFAGELNLLQNTKDSSSLRIFGYDFTQESFYNDLKIDDAHAIIHEAHISTNTQKYIAIFAYSYSIIAQNALLKILEEPPRFVTFIIFASGKNKLIPTIFSRLPYFDKREREPIEPFSLDITRLNVPMVYEYISDIESKNLNSQSGHKILTSLLFSIANHNICLSESDLKRFDLAIKSLYAKQSVHLTLLPILLSLVKN